MDMSLIRTQWTKDGIFGLLYNKFYTCEHAYLAPDNQSWIAKIPMGEFTCVRGTHQLAGASKPFETFEVKDVPKFLGRSVAGILFHPGNTEADSSGCILLGMALGELDGISAVLNSRIAFEQFMALQEGLDSFTLTVTG